jgi:hypothetical protein
MVKKDLKSLQTAVYASIDETLEFEVQNNPKAKRQPKIVH